MAPRRMQEEEERRPRRSREEKKTEPVVIFSDGIVLTNAFYLPMPLNNVFGFKCQLL